MDCVLLKFQLVLKVCAYVFPVKIRSASYCHKKLIIGILWNFLKLLLKSLPTWIYPSFELRIYLHNTFSPFGVVVAKKNTACAMQDLLGKLRKYVLSLFPCVVMMRTQ
jgi:hypothetical protein